MKNKNPFKPGDKVRCVNTDKLIDGKAIDGGLRPIHRGEEYEVSHVNGGYIGLTDVRLLLFHHSRFVPVDESTNETSLHPIAFFVILSLMMFVSALMGERAFGFALWLIMFAGAVYFGTRKGGVR